MGRPARRGDAGKESGRYYWPDAAVQAEVQTLIRNLTECPPPLTLVSQFLPVQYEAVRAGVLANEPAGLARDRVRQVLRIYSAACGVRK